MTNISISKTVSVTRRKAGQVKSHPEYLKYQKRLMCPYCNEKHYVNVLNMNAFQDSIRGTMIVEGIRCLLMMFAAGIVIMFVMSIPIGIADKVHERKIEQKYSEQMRW